MIRTIGFIELNSIAKGIETADTMVKAADVQLLKAHSVCPGKYIILICGDVAAVEAAINTGIEIGRSYVVDQLVLPSIHPQLIEAIHATNNVQEVNALGVLEFFNIATAIVAADAAAKTAAVTLIEVRLGLSIGGKSFIILCGDISSVQEAVEAGANIGKEKGMLVEKTVIPSPRKELFEKLL
ncbi:Carboxysome shell and ethanolamine utilization microcompartment protein CcmL/EutN [Anaerovirgula multivorans]|uniref:Carboxysome shell and ethanolamine utilization microcompartment protein CcmL/EutN n=1 Tax=Anaerovirgula multivorans TaxID=312168 RepID=A0A239BZ21_9FIRM|nr:BMC domain-containing protein [Anaerovirgula multivorans]SNS12354.1 Carboxysome shell and ethanolamine utilization microcompartment protein CcmL/EutN [Anaerovirgula multivorans]